MGHELLIVLNGIEIAETHRMKALSDLLIVLNGIEMYGCRMPELPRLSFNRTKWN